MTLDHGSADIIQLAWARHLGLADRTFGDALSSHERIVHVDDAAASVQFIRLFGASALVGPAWAIEAAADIPDEDLAQHVTLMTLARDHGGHGLGATALFFADDLPLKQPGKELTVSRAHRDVVELESRCPPDDVNEVGLADMTHHFTVIHDDEGRHVPIASAGYAEWEGLLAQLGVLVEPDRRRQGLGSLAASIASHEALASGLTLQWRAEVSNTGSLAIARSLGLVAGGIHTTVLLGDSASKK